MELLDRIRSNWAKTPARVVMVEHRESGRGAVTGAELGARVDEARRRLSERVGEAGAGRGGRIGLVGENSIELAATLLAALDGGLAVAPLHPTLPPEEIAARGRRFGLDAVLGAGAVLGEGAGAGAGVGAGAGAGVGAGAGAGAGVGAALLLMTSGTTGEARAVLVGRESLSRHLLGIVDEVLGIGPGEATLCALPLAHSFGCRMGLLAPLAAGAVVHLVPRFSARQTMAILEREGVVWAPLVPTMLAAWAALPGAPPGGLRWVLSAGAPLPDGLGARAQARLGCPVREGYGLTEASFATIDRPADPARVGVVGRPTPGVEVRLVGPGGEVLGQAPGVRGAVQIRGVNVMAGYLGDPEGTRAVFTADGWLETGDVGAWDEVDAARLRIVDRVKDIVLTGGYTVHPAEVERALSRVPGVRECAVFGMPDAFLGERVAAAVVPAFGANAPDGEGGAEGRGGWGGLVEALEAEARAHLPAHAVPRSWFRFDALPMGPSGKVLKRELREQCSQIEGEDAGRGTG